MAYQRPFLISLKRSNAQEPWGFRTFGGKEYGEPHVVEKVVPDSTAERCGIREGDEIIQIGRANIQDFTFGQVQELLARSGNKIEMFVIREDLLSPRKGKEPSHVKAIVHNPYNSPLNLYSTENIAETLAKQAEVLTEGHVSSAEEEDAPENLSFKQKSAVFQLLEEQARQETVNQHPSRANIPRKAPPPPPKAPPSAAQYYQNKENYNPQEHIHNSVQIQQHQQPVAARDSELYTRKPPTEYRREEQKHTNYSVQSQQSIQLATANHYTTAQHQTSEYRSGYRVNPPSPIQENQTAVTTAQYQQQQNIRQQQNPQEIAFQQQREKQQMQQQQWQPQYHGISQQQQQMQRQQQQHYQTQTQQQQHYQSQPQQHYQSQPQHQQHYQTQTQHQQHAQHQAPKAQHYQNEVQYNESQPTGAPISYKAPPSQKPRVNWPPPNAAQQNGRWNSPSPTPSSPSKATVTAMWPPKQPTVRELPKSGFNPAVLKEQGTGRRCVWPPPKPDDEFRSGRTTPQSPVTGRRIVWNPSPSPPPIRRSPFGSASPITRRKDIAWPPPQPTVHKVENMQHRPSPTLARKANFDDYVKQHASMNVPSTYRPPPGTQRVEYA